MNGTRLRKKERKGRSRHTTQQPTTQHTNHATPAHSPVAASTPLPPLLSKLAWNLASKRCDSRFSRFVQVGSRFRCLFRPFGACNAATSAWTPFEPTACAAGDSSTPLRGSSGGGGGGARGPSPSGGGPLMGWGMPGSPSRAGSAKGLRAGAGAT